MSSYIRSHFEAIDAEFDGIEGNDNLPNDYDEQPEYLAGCRAYWSGRVVLAGNPYPKAVNEAAHTLWQQGFIDASEADSN